MTTVKSTLMALAAVVFSAAAAYATTARPYVPGGAPCAGRCPFAWAVEQAGVEVPKDYELKIMTLPKGTMTSNLAFYRDGKAQWDHASRVLAKDEQAIGFSTVDRDGNTVIFARLDACKNWGVFTLPAAGGGMGGYAASAPLFPPYGSGILPPAGSPSYPGGPGSPGVFPLPIPIPIPVGHPTVPGNPGGGPTGPGGPYVPPPPAPVPIPATGILLTIGLLMLSRFKTQKQTQGDM